MSKDDFSKKRLRSNSSELNTYTIQSNKKTLANNTENSNLNNPLAKMVLSPTINEQIEQTTMNVEIAKDILLEQINSESGIDIKVKLPFRISFAINNKTRNKLMHMLNGNIIIASINNSRTLQDFSTIDSINNILNFQVKNESSLKYETPDILFLQEIKISKEIQETIVSSNGKLLTHFYENRDYKKKEK